MGEFSWMTVSAVKMDFLSILKRKEKGHLYGEQDGTVVSKLALSITQLFKAIMKKYNDIFRQYLGICGRRTHPWLIANIP